MAIFPSVTPYRDGTDQPLESGVMNVPVNQLRERTDYLKERIDELIGTGPFESVRFAGVPLNPSDLPWIGSVVYFDPATRVYSRAKSEILVSSVYPYSLVADKGYVIGLMATAPSGATGTVVAYGKVDLSGVLLSTIVDEGETFRSGPYFLSTTTAGRITANPKGPAIYIGMFYSNVNTPLYGDFAELAPQLKDMWEAHLHKSFILASQPSGTAEKTGTDFDDTWSVRGFNPDGCSVPWAAGVHTASAIVVPTVLNGHAYSCTVSAAPAADTTEPAWPVNGGTVVHQGYTWQDLGNYARLVVCGSYTGVGDEYTFWLEAALGDLHAAVIKCSTVAGTDDVSTGVPVNFYNQEVEIGTKGLKVKLEMGPAPSAWGTVDFAFVAATASARADSTWTLDIPLDTKGWREHTVDGFAAYTGANTAKKPAVRIFGHYVSVTTDGNQSIKILVTDLGGGDLTSNPATVEVELYDVNDALIGAAQLVRYSGIAYHIVDTGNIDLWFTISDIDINGAPLDPADAVLEVDDEWTFTFMDEAPNAKFEYVVGHDANLHAYYPPAPLLDMALEINGVNMDRRNAFKDGNGSYDGTYMTLYWWNDVYNNVPWAVDWDAVTPLEENMKNTQLHSSYMRLGSAGIVTSLAPRDGGGVSLTDKRTGLPATTGDLEITTALPVSSSDAKLPGYSVFKDLDSLGRLAKGPVVEKIIPGAGITLSSNSPDSTGQGIVRIDADTSGLTYGDFSDTFFLNAKQEIIPNRLFSYIKLLPWTTDGATNVPSAFVCKFKVPDLLVGSYQVKVYATVFGVETVTDAKYAGLKFSWSVGPDYTLNGALPAEVIRNFSKANTADGVLEMTPPLLLLNDIKVGISGSGYTQYDPFLVHNDPTATPVEGQVLDAFMNPFPNNGLEPIGSGITSVSAGNIVSIKFERAPVQQVIHKGALEYTYALGFIGLKWRLVAV